MEDAVSRLNAVKANISAVEAERKRQAGSVSLVAVSKTFSADEIRPVLAAGQRVFGENRVQEADARWTPLKPDYPGIELHLVGPLQTNKLARALDLFDAIHSLDRDSLATKLARAGQARGACPRLFVQVNTGREPQKAGIDPDALDAFLATCRGTLALHPEGLMCIPPVDADPAPHFAALAAMAARNGLGGLSMGMSDDFETAIAQGATHVRIGSAIFGARA